MPFFYDEKPILQVAGVHFEGQLGKIVAASTFEMSEFEPVTNLARCLGRIHFAENNQPRSSLSNSEYSSETSKMKALPWYSFKRSRIVVVSLVIEGKRRRLLGRKKVVYMKQATEGELAKEIKRAIKRGALPNSMSDVQVD